MALRARKVSGAFEKRAPGPVSVRSVETQNVLIERKEIVKNCSVIKNVKQFQHD